MGRREMVMRMVKAMVLDQHPDAVRVAYPESDDPMAAMDLIIYNAEDKPCGVLSVFGLSRDEVNAALAAHHAETNG